MAQKARYIKGLRAFGGVGDSKEEGERSRGREMGGGGACGCWWAGLTVWAGWCGLRRGFEGRWGGCGRGWRANNYSWHNVQSCGVCGCIIFISLICS